jgi:hypothetical protein
MGTEYLEKAKAVESTTKKMDGTNMEMLLTQMLAPNQRGLLNVSYEEIEEFANGRDPYELRKDFDLMILNIGYFFKGIKANMARVLSEKLEELPVVDDEFIRSIPEGKTLRKSEIEKLCGLTAKEIMNNVDQFGQKPFAGVYAKSFATWLKANHLTFFNAFRTNYQLHVDRMPLRRVLVIPIYQVQLEEEQRPAPAQLPPAAQQQPMEEQLPLQMS